MRAVVQRVRNCKVEVDGNITGELDKGLLVYIAVAASDTAEDIQYIGDKVINLRIFKDDRGKMNLSILDKPGYDFMVISQFTLYGDTRKGRRPSYIQAADPRKGSSLYHDFIGYLHNKGFSPSQGIFGAMMNVHYINEGPVTILLDSEKNF
jgi:D-tyrosyl-tRNA(Tyr) deacylase